MNTRPDPWKQDFNQLWDIYDRNENGYLEPDEAADLFSDLFSWNRKETPNNRYQTMFNLMDANGDGKISKAELKKVIDEEQR